MLAGMYPSDMVLLKFSKTDTKTLLLWEHDTEFEFQGQMFDVVEMLEKGDSVTYRCWPDKEETQLNRQLAQLVSGEWESHPIKREGQKQLLDYFKSFFGPTDIQWAFQVPNDSSNQPRWLCFFSLPTSAHSPPAPPPKIS